MTSKYLPDETINSVLLSSTSRFVGSIENDSILLTHAWDFLKDSDTLFVKELFDG